jgi:hypothetical protein
VDTTTTAQFKTNKDHSPPQYEAGAASGCTIEVVDYVTSHPTNIQPALLLSIEIPQR